jgi:hypothetical protein
VCVVPSSGLYLLTTHNKTTNSSCSCCSTSASSSLFVLVLAVSSETSSSSSLSSQSKGNQIHGTPTTYQTPSQKDQSLGIGESTQFQRCEEHLHYSLSFDSNYQRVVEGIVSNPQLGLGCTIHSKVLNRD